MLARHFQIALAHAEGATLDELSEKFHVNRSRIHQIWTEALEILRLSRFTKEQLNGNAVASAIFRHTELRNYRHEASKDTPEGLYLEIEGERKRDDQEFWNKRRAAGYQEY